MASQYGNMECNNMGLGLFYIAILIPIAFIIFYVFKLTISTNRCPKCGKRISEYYYECEEYAVLLGF